MRYAQQVIDGDIPEVSGPLTEKTRSFYEKRGIVFLQDEWEQWHIRVWMNSLLSYGMGVQVNPAVVYQYADDYEMNRTEVFELIKQIDGGVSYGKRTKAGT